MPGNGLETVADACYISLGQRYPFGGSTGAPRHYLGALNLLEQGTNKLGKPYLGLVPRVRRPLGRCKGHSTHKHCTVRQQV